MKDEFFITSIKDNWIPSDQRNHFSAAYQFVVNLKKDKGKIQDLGFSKEAKRGSGAESD
jgi:hypothetical protein